MIYTSFPLIEKSDDEDFTMDDDFLDMVTRSNIPQPKVSEKQLGSEIARDSSIHEQLREGTR